MILLITLLSGGTGTPKLLQGLMELLPQEEISVIVNTGEDVEVSGLRVSPDLDTVVYTLADIIDSENWYGIDGDSYELHKMLGRLDHDEVLRVGDKDRAVQLYRTFRMSEGATLSQVTEEICQSLGVSADVLPMSNDRVTTRIIADDGEEMLFHEFWVVRDGNVDVSEVIFEGSDDADPSPGVLEAIEDSDSVIIGPSNPVTSLGPILSIEEIKEALRENRDKVLAISPILGYAPVSGPAGVLMEGLGHEVSPVGVARVYKDIVDNFVIHYEDEDLRSKIEDLDLNVFLTDILISGKKSKIELGKNILEFSGYKKI